MSIVKLCLNLLGYLTKRKGFFRQRGKCQFFRSTVWKKGYKKPQKYLLSEITLVAISPSQTQFSGTLIWYKCFEQLSFLFLVQARRNTSPNLHSAPLYFSIVSKCNSCRAIFRGKILWTVVFMLRLWQRFGVFLFQSQLGLSATCWCFFFYCHHIDVAQNVLQR